MAKKCIYCGGCLEDGKVIDFCHVCGYKVFGKRMYEAIVENMEKARDKGDLFQGNIIDQIESNPCSNIKK